MDSDCICVDISWKFLFCNSCNVLNRLDSLCIRATCYRRSIMSIINITHCLMCLHVTELLYTEECNLSHCCCVHHEVWSSESVRHRGWERLREERVRQAPTHAPAPYMHPIHSYLVPVTRWLQNGIDYWFPLYHRSVVLAGYSGLTESPAWDNKGSGEVTRGGNTHITRHTSTYTHSY